MEHRVIQKSRKQTQRRMKCLVYLESGEKGSVAGIDGTQRAMAGDVAGTAAGHPNV